MEEQTTVTIYGLMVLCFRALLIEYFRRWFIARHLEPLSGTAGDHKPINLIVIYVCV